MKARDGSGGWLLPGACWRRCDLQQEQRDIVAELAARVGGQPIQQPVRGGLKIRVTQRV